MLNTSVHLSMRRSCKPSRAGRTEDDRAYSEAFALRESQRPWSRAFRRGAASPSEYAKHARPALISCTLRRPTVGDISAYAIERYAKPSDESRPSPTTPAMSSSLRASQAVDPTPRTTTGQRTLDRGRRNGHHGTVVQLRARTLTSTRIRGERRWSRPAKVPPPLPASLEASDRHNLFALSKEGRVLQRRLDPSKDITRPSREPLAFTDASPSMKGSGRWRCSLGPGLRRLTLQVRLSPTNTPIHLSRRGSLRLGSDNSF